MICLQFDNILSRKRSDEALDLRENKSAHREHNVQKIGNAFSRTSFNVSGELSLMSLREANNCIVQRFKVPQIPSPECMQPPGNRVGRA